MIKVWTTTLTEQQADKRDYIAWNLLKNLDKIEPPSELMWWISETVYQWSVPACTACCSSNSMTSQNELEYKQKILLSWQDLRTKMWHKMTDKTWDSLENAVNTVVKKWIQGVVEWRQQLFQADSRAYGKRDIWQKAITFSPLLSVIYWMPSTWDELLAGELKTVYRRTTKSLGHWVCLAGYDTLYVYFYNSFGDKINKNWISNFKVSWATFNKMIAQGMLNRRRFWLYDTKDLVDFSKEKELSNQIINACKKLYDIWDAEMKAKFEEWQISKFLTDKYWL